MSKESDVKFCSKSVGWYHRWTQYNLCFGWKLGRHIHCDGKGMKAGPPMEGGWGEMRGSWLSFFREELLGTWRMWSQMAHVQQGGSKLMLS